MKREIDVFRDLLFEFTGGSCSCSGGVFKGCYNMMGGVNEVIPVSAFVPGCPARPEAIIDGVVKLLMSLQATK